LRAYLAVLSHDLIVDYVSRITGDDFYTSGIPESIWFFVQVIAFGMLLYFLVKGLKDKRPIMLKAMLLGRGIFFLQCLYMFF